MVSAADNQAGLNLAANVAADSVGLGGVPVASWSQDDRIAYLSFLANEILSQPDAFTPETVASAQHIAGNASGLQLENFWTYSPDGAPSLAKTFVDTLGDKVLGGGQSLANLGAGTLNLVSRAGNIASNVGTGLDTATQTAASTWVVPLAVIAFFGLFVINAERQVEKAVRG